MGAVIVLGGLRVGAQVAPALTGLGRTSGQRSADVGALTASARTSLREQRYPEAMEQFEVLLKAGPKNGDARQGEVDAATAWALAEIRAQHPDRAMEVLERALQQVPDNPELLTDFGIEATALGQFPIAGQVLQAADKLRPHYPKTVYGLARLEIEQQRWPDAERALKAYLVLRPEDGSAYFGLGHVYAVQQRDEEARSAFERSIQLQPKQTESYYQMGQLALQAHQDAEAQVYFSKALERLPTHAGALTGMGQIALRAKEYARAEQYLGDAEKSDPAYQTPHYFRGLALAKLGRKEEAEREMRLGDSRTHAADPRREGGESPSLPASSPPAS